MNLQISHPHSPTKSKNPTYVPQTIIAHSNWLPIVMITSVDVLLNWNWISICQIDYRDKLELLSFSFEKNCVTLKYVVHRCVLVLPPPPNNRKTYRNRLKATMRAQVVFKGNYWHVVVRFFELGFRLIMTWVTIWRALMLWIPIFWIMKWNKS